MTLREVADMALGLTVDHKINGQHFTKAEFREVLGMWLRNHTSQYVGTMVLPDGEWFVQFSRSGEYYDLYIPDTREQEEELLEKTLFYSV